MQTFLVFPNHVKFTLTLCCFAFSTLPTIQDLTVIILHHIQYKTTPRGISIFQVSFQSSCMMQLIHLKNVVVGTKILSFLL